MAAVFAAKALPHCRLASAAPPPPPATVASEQRPPPKAFPPQGSALATETEYQRQLWLVVLLLLRGALTLLADGNGFLVPVAVLESASWRQTTPEREAALLAAAAAIGGVTPQRRLTPGTEGRRKRPGVHLLLLEQPQLRPLLAALIQCPYPPGGRWPLLPPLSVVLEAEGLPAGPLGPPPPAGVTEAPAVALRRQWEGLSSGRPLGGRRKLPSLGRQPPDRNGSRRPPKVTSFSLVGRHPRRPFGGSFSVNYRSQGLPLKRHLCLIGKLWRSPGETGNGPDAAVPTADDGQGVGRGGGEWG